MTSKRLWTSQWLHGLKQREREGVSTKRNGFNALTVMLGAVSKDIGTALQPSSVLVMREALESVVRPRDGSTLRNRADRTRLVALGRVDGDLMSELAISRIWPVTKG